MKTINEQLVEELFEGCIFHSYIRFSVLLLIDHQLNISWNYRMVISELI